MKKHFLTIIILFLITSCNNRELIVDKEKLLATDYRLFQETPAWTLAKAVQDNNTA